MSQQRVTAQSPNSFWDRNEMDLSRQRRGVSSIHRRIESTIQGWDAQYEGKMRMTACSPWNHGKYCYIMPHAVGKWNVHRNVYEYVKERKRAACATVGKGSLIARAR